MPRLSIDIDLTYLPIEEREISITNITASLIRTKERIASHNAQIRVILDEVRSKLTCSQGRFQIKVEVNQTGRQSCKTSATTNRPIQRTRHHYTTLITQAFPCEAIKLARSDTLRKQSRSADRGCFHSPAQSPAAKNAA